jgi:DUF177 domain-containing protein
MVIKVADIPVEGLKVEISEGPEALGDLGGDVRPSGPVKGIFSLSLAGETVVVSGEVEAVVELDCSRCGKAFTTEVKARLDVDLNPVEALAGEEEKELHAGDMDVGFYSGGEVDLAALMSEQIALNLPMKPLCSDGCLGVCQFCGQDLNEKDCGCAPPAGHPGFEGLKELLDKMKKEGAKKEDGEPN